MPKLAIYTVDAFSKDSQPFTGNPAAVCLVPPGIHLDDATQLRIAAEMNLSETAFVQPILPNTPQGQHFSAATAESPTTTATSSIQSELFRLADHFALRWFTPTCEVPLCGHATLAASHVLFSEVGSGASVLKFETLSGQLRVTNDPCYDQSRLTMVFPLDKPRCLSDVAAAVDRDGDATTTFGDHGHAEVPGAVRMYSRAWTAKVQEIVDVTLATSSVPLTATSVLYAPNNRYLVVHIDNPHHDPDILQRLSPISSPTVITLGHQCNLDLVAVMAALPPGLPGGPDAAVRVFAPWLGVSEDPITGSACTVYAPYWQSVTGAARATYVQGASRQGFVETMLSPEMEGKVQITGCAVTVVVGQIRF
ncbi:hypothetical protein IWQ60_005885 [Tieghemiomyces parasiticus]|uniref:Uncharacterized protein n=1 Tax=Tieghemiomyces parasiticus TaxID=78921 RepID=A0A9W8AD84_9FUNG|nr:hypothetical protein IWQ60_005885 [Tieghemiomyces parasiticus]